MRSVSMFGRSIGTAAAVSVVTGTEGSKCSISGVLAIELKGGCVRARCDTLCFNGYRHFRVPDSSRNFSVDGTVDAPMEQVFVAGAFSTC